MKTNYDAAEAEIPYSGGVPLTPNVRPAIICSGSDYDIGYQWYQQTVQIFGRKPLEERAHRQFSAEETAALKAYQWYIRKYTPYMIAMLKGMVAGANDAGIPLTYEEVLAKWALDPFQSEADLFQRIASLSDEERRVHHFIVKKMAVVKAPITAELIAGELGMPIHQVLEIINKLEKLKTFIYRSDGKGINWAYPLSLENTGFRMTAYSGEQFFAA